MTTPAVFSGVTGKNETYIFSYIGPEPFASGDIRLLKLSISDNPTPEVVQYFVDDKFVSQSQFGASIK